MESLYGPSTSKQFDEVRRVNNRCHICKNTRYTKDVLRLVITQLSILLIRMNIKNGIITIKSKKVERFKKIPVDDGMLFPLYDQSDSELYRLTIQFSQFVKRFSKILGTNVRVIKDSIENIMTSFDATTSTSIYLDFDSQKLMEVTEKRCGEIEDAIIYTFTLRRNKFMTENLDIENWFVTLDCYGNVIPCNTMQSSCSQLMKESSDCIHIIEQRDDKAVRWYFLNAHGESSYSTFVEREKNNKKQKKNMKKETANVVIFEEYNEENGASIRYHEVRYFSTKNGITTKKYPFDSKYIIDSLKDPFMQVEVTLPFIIQNYNRVTTRYIFHMIYKDNVEPTEENFYMLLTLLKDVLTKMHIDCVVMRNCVPFDTCTIQRMLEYLFTNTNIKLLRPKGFLKS